MSRKWLQFGLRWFFVAVLVVAAYCAGYAQRANQLRLLTEDRDVWKADAHALKQECNDLREEWREAEDDWYKERNELRRWAISWADND